MCGGAHSRRVDCGATHLAALLRVVVVRHLKFVFDLNVGGVHSVCDIAGAACRITFDNTPCGDDRVEQDVDDGIALNEAEAWVAYP